MKTDNKGFSLIELSIVLIIIGLLVAGVTGGASLIKSAQVSSTISQLRNINTAMYAYRVEYGVFPAEKYLKSLSSFRDTDPSEYTYELWNDLNKSGIYDFKPEKPTGDIIIPGKHTPKLALGGSGIYRYITTSTLYKYNRMTLGFSKFDYSGSGLSNSDFVFSKKDIDGLIKKLDLKVYTIEEFTEKCSGGKCKGWDIPSMAVNVNGKYYLDLELANDFEFMKTITDAIIFIDF